MTELLSKEHTILERPFMEFRPFGVNERGEKIRDVTGQGVRAHVEYLHECVTRTSGHERGERVVHELCCLLNERIRDPVYHVTPAFLKNPWNSYSYEFVSFLREFAEMLSGDPNYQFNMGKEKHISPLMQTLGRPFSVSQIYKMFPYFAQKYVKGSHEFDVGVVTDRSAILRVKFTDKVYQQFGPYRKACAEAICQIGKGSLSSVPERIHHLPPATVRDRACIVDGDEYCEWEFTWIPQSGSLFRPAAGLLAAGSAYVYVRAIYPAVSIAEALVLTLLPATISWLAISNLEKQAKSLKALIMEQDQSVEARHEELREAYLDQEQTGVELKKMVNQLTTLHSAGLIFSSTFDRDTIVDSALQALVKTLSYDRAMISFYDSERRVSHAFRALGVSREVRAFLGSLEVPVTTPESLEALVLLKGTPLLVGDVREVWPSLHPLNQRLASLLKSKAFITVPLRVKDRILGALTVDRLGDVSLTQDDLNLMVTFANQLAIALNNVDAYRQIEEAYRQIEALNVGLEARVRERTADLEAANEQLKEMDRLKSQFLAHVSHELRTPLTSIKGFVDNMLEGLAGALSEKQAQYLTRIKANGSRLARMITDLLDRSRIEAGKLALSLEEIALLPMVSDVIEQIRPIALAKHQRLQLQCDDTDLTVWADIDRLSQIVTNLLDNAIKYTQDGGSVTVRVTREAAHFAKVTVMDNGPGIPCDALPKLFDPFFRAGHYQRSRIKGLGLGLSIAKELVELHGGLISVHSDEGKGAEFRFTIPIRRRIEERMTAPKLATRILVVDDDQDIRQLLVDRLESYGYEVQTAPDGTGAIKAYQSREFDGVVLDIGMPEMDGIEVLRQVREQNTTIPIVMVTASGSKQRAIEAVGMGAQAYLLKPFDLDELQQVMGYWFGKSAGEPDQTKTG